MRGTTYLLPDGLPRPRLRGWLHLGAVPVAVGLGVALTIAAPSGKAAAVAAIYACAVLALFATSATYHRGRWTPKVRGRLKRVDHSMIFVLIAGTYTPVCVLTIGGTLGTVMLALAWGGAALGVLLNVLPFETPRWLEVAVYIGVGWVAAAAFPDLLDALGVTATVLIAIGGLLYTGGAVVYGLKRPDPAPAVFGYHEVFHACTIAAAALHYAVIGFWVIPAA